MNKKIIQVIFIFLISIFIANASTLKLDHYLVDNANIIDSSDEYKINELIKQIEQNTTAEIAVVTINSLEGNTIEDSAIEIFEENKIGKKDVDNGLLLLVSLNDRKYRIEVGYGLEGIITDVVSMQLGTKILEPNFRNGDYGLGILESLIVIKGYLENNDEIISKFKTQSNNYGNNKIKSIVFSIAIILFMILIISKRFRRNGIGAAPIFFGGFGGGFNGGNIGGSSFGGFGGGLSGGGGFSGGW